MAQVQTQSIVLPRLGSVRHPTGSNNSIVAPIIPVDPPAKSVAFAKMNADATSPVNQFGCFEFDRVIKAGTVLKRTQKTKIWKPIYIVLRPNTLSIYKDAKEAKLRHKIYLSDLTTVTFLKDPKQKRQHMFGLFSPSKNFHFQAPTAKEAQEWVEQIRLDARIEEEEEEMFLASPARRQSGAANNPPPTIPQAAEFESLMMTRNTPNQLDPPAPMFSTDNLSHGGADSTAAFSGNELASHSDFSDSDMQRMQGLSLDDSSAAAAPTTTTAATTERPAGGVSRSGSQNGGDLDRVIWQGWLWFLKSKGGVRKWKNYWAVVRPRNVILYKDATEYTAQFVLQLSAILNVVDIDPISRTKKHCLQMITEEKSFRFCAHDEEALVQCLGAFKSQLAKRR